MGVRFTDLCSLGGPQQFPLIRFSLRKTVGRLIDHGVSGLKFMKCEMPLESSSNKCSLQSSFLLWSDMDRSTSRRSQIWEMQGAGSIYMLLSLKLIKKKAIYATALSQRSAYLFARHVFVSRLPPRIVPAELYPGGRCFRKEVLMSKVPHGEGIVEHWVGSAGGAEQTDTSGLPEAVPIEGEAPGSMSWHPRRQLRRD